MPILIRIGRFVLNLARARKSTAPGKSFVIEGPDAERLRAQLAARAGSWRPVVIVRDDRNRGPPSLTASVAVASDT